MTKLIKEVVGQLKDWKEAFLESVDSDISHGVEDLLDNIQVGKHKCYASYLFNQLTDKDKSIVMDAIDFDVNFEELYTVYYNK